MPDIRRQLADIARPFGFDPDWRRVEDDSGRHRNDANSCGYRELCTIIEKPVGDEAASDCGRGEHRHNIPEDARLHEASQPILDAIQAGLDALDATPPRLTVAANVRRHVAEVLSGSTTFLRLVLGSIIPTAVLLALLFQRVFSSLRTCSIRSAMSSGRCSVLY